MKGENECGYQFIIAFTPGRGESALLDHVQGGRAGDSSDPPARQLDAACTVNGCGGLVVVSRVTHGAPAAPPPRLGSLGSPCTCAMVHIGSSAPNCTWNCTVHLGASELMRTRIKVRIRPLAPNHTVHLGAPERLTDVLRSRGTATRAYGARQLCCAGGSILLDDTSPQPPPSVALTSTCTRTTTPRTGSTSSGYSDEYAEAMSYTRGMTEHLAAAGRAGRLR